MVQVRRPATDGRAASSSVLLRPTASLQAHRAPGLVLAGLRVGFKSRVRRATVTLPLLEGQAAADE